MSNWQDDGVCSAKQQCCCRHVKSSLSLLVHCFAFWVLTLVICAMQNVPGLPQPMRSLSNKVMRRPLPGKENGPQPYSNMPAGLPGQAMASANAYTKESYGGQEPLGPPATINRLTRPPSGAYDRYAEPAYQQNVVPAW